MARCFRGVWGCHYQLKQSLQICVRLQISCSAGHAAERGYPARYLGLGVAVIAIAVLMRDTVVVLGEATVLRVQQ